MARPTALPRFVPAVAVIVAAASACTSAAEKTAGSAPDLGLSPPPITQTTAPSSYAAAEAALPLSSYLEPAGHLAVLRARGLLITQCMHANGFPSYTAQIHEMPNAVTATDTGGPYGYIDAANAARYGFHSPDAARPSAPDTTMDQAEQQQEGKCTIAVQPELAKNAQGAESMLPSSFWNRTTAATAADPRVKNAYTAWSACMKAAGYAASDPTTLARSFLTAGSAMTANEVSAAEADVSCTKSENLAGIYFAVLAGYQSETLGKNAAQLAAVKSANDVEASNAAKAIAAGG